VRDESPIIIIVVAITMQRTTQKDIEEAEK
jgi:hypothetical protein